MTGDQTDLEQLLAEEEEIERLSAEEAEIEQWVANCRVVAGRVRAAVDVFYELNDIIETVADESRGDPELWRLMRCYARHTRDAFLGIGDPLDDTELDDGGQR